MKRRSRWMGEELGCDGSALGIMYAWVVWR